MDKFCHFKSFIASTQEYIKQSNEATVSVLQRNLGVISATIDPSIFDPNSSIATEFYASLYDLISILDSKSTLMWSAIDVLQMACKNTAAKQAVIHTYRFVPILTKLLEECPSNEKQIHVLRIIEELTFGNKIDWQEAHLPALIKILVKWILESKEDEVISLALGVLINICYKNLAVIYTFMNSVNTKLFTSKLLKMNPASEETRIKCCKFLIILENMGKDISEKMVLQFVNVTFNNIIPALKKKDTQLLKHIIEFYTNVKSNERCYDILLKYPSYMKNIEAILITLENISDSECSGLMMEFFVFILKLRLKELLFLYPNFARFAMKWVPVEQVSSRALTVIKSILIDVNKNVANCNELNSSEILDVTDISVLLLVSNNNTDMTDSKQSEESINRFSELMQVLEELVKYKNIRMKILESFSVKTMQTILKPILSSYGEDNGNYLQIHSSSMFIYALSLISDLALDNALWKDLYTDLLQTKQVQMIIAHALFIGDEHVKEKIFTLSNKDEFCKFEVAHRMRELEPLLLIQSAATLPQSFSRQDSHPEIGPFSYVQQEKLNTFIEKLESIFESNNGMNMPTSAVMELYEYKLAAMRHSEKALQNSLQAADNYSTNLQHRLKQISVASNRLHGLLFYTQQCLEGCQQEKQDLIKKIEEMENESKKAHAQLLQQSQLQYQKLQQQYQKLQQDLIEKDETIKKQKDENTNLSRTLKTIQELLGSK